MRTTSEDLGPSPTPQVIDSWWCGSPCERRSGDRIPGGQGRDEEEGHVCGEIIFGNAASEGTAPGSATLTDWHLR